MRPRPGLNLGCADSPPAAQRSSRFAQNLSPHATPSGMEHAHHIPIARGNEDRRTVRRKHDQRLIGEVGQEAVIPVQGVGAARGRNENPRVVDLQGRDVSRGKFTLTEETGEMPWLPGVPLPGARGQSDNAQGCWIMELPDSLPDWTPRIAIMISSGFEEASSAVSREMPPFWIRLTSA